MSKGLEIPRVSISEREKANMAKRLIRLEALHSTFEENGISPHTIKLNAHQIQDIKKYAADTDYVMIHDAARPCLSQELIGFCLKAAGGHDGAIPVLPMKDTVYSSTDGQRISSLLERNEIFAGQAPEVFVLGKYLEANESLLPDRILQINGSTEPAVMAGMDIAMIPGEEKNFKITTQADLERFCRIIERGIDR